MAKRGTAKRRKSDFIFLGSECTGTQILLNGKFYSKEQYKRIEEEAERTGANLYDAAEAMATTFAEEKAAAECRPA